jgi:hypothetical protein
MTKLVSSKSRQFSNPRLLQTVLILKHDITVPETSDGDGDGGLGGLGVPKRPGIGGLGVPKRPGIGGDGLPRTGVGGDGLPRTGVGGPKRRTLWVANRDVKNLNIIYYQVIFLLS